MRWLQKVAYGLAVVMAFGVISSLVPSPAQAASDYDALIRTIPSLYVYTDGAAKSQKMDISATWLADLEQSYTKRMEQNIGWPTNFIQELEDIKTSHGSLGVFEQINPDGNVVVVVGSRDPHAYCGFVGPASTGTYQCTSHAGYGYIRADYFTHNSYGGNGCYGSGGDRCSDDGMNIYSAPIVETGTTGYTFVNMGLNAGGIEFYFMDFDLTYPSGYAGVRIPTSRQQSPDYVAMGDSFSSGEGNAPYEVGTDTDTNGCHRSLSAYPRQLQASLHTKLGSMAFVACSGAISDYIINSINKENIEEPQALAVSSTTKLVTMTMAGNDVGFGTVLTTCALATDRKGTAKQRHRIEHDACMLAIKNAQVIASSAALRDKLKVMLSGVRSLGSGDLQVIEGGYPNLLPKFKDITGTCVWGGGAAQTSGRNVSSDEIVKARALHDTLNATILAAVAATNDNHIHFVDPSSLFDGHELCRPHPWFNNVMPSIDPRVVQQSYHPNGAGETAYATVMRVKANKLLP